MNHIYKTVYNASLGTWVAVSELAKGKSKNSTKSHSARDWQSCSLTTEKRVLNSFSYCLKTLATGLLACSPNAWALPTGDQLVAGQATVSTPAANVMQINQSSQRAAINWQGFSIGQNETVNIQQPNSQAALLNRVVGQDASQIQGRLNANGQVYLVNPNGVIFSKTAQVDVGGLVATTHNISDQDFMNGKNHFTQNGATGKVENHGTINAKDGGVVALIGEQVTNTGTINTPKGTTALAAGKTVDLDFQGDGLVEVKVSEAVLNAQITNKGAIQADGGRVVMTTKAANALIDTVINQEGVVKARGMTERNGEIILEGGLVSQTGTLDVSGKTGGKVDINARAILDAGKTNADGTAGQGGTINFKASDAIIQTAAADTHANGTTQGGTVHLEATNSTFSSGKLSAKGEQGGTINVLSNDRVVLAAAELDASGEKQGGTVRVGGDFHGNNPNIKNAKTTTVNGATKIKADGGKGKVVVWSDEKTDYYGSISANLGGEIEVSSKGTLTYAGSADAGIGGSLLLDPKNIIITASGSVASYGLIDPHAAAGNNFGAATALLGTTVGGVFTENGNIVVTSPNDSLAASYAGAVYLFNVTTGQLLATLTGSSANDYVGNGGITVLSNGNYVVNSSSWSNGAGAVTWGNGLTGVSGVVSSSNSLVGTAAGNQVGIGGITALNNGNYVVNSLYWDNGAIINAGAVTWGSGTAGVSGAVSSSNSLIGITAADRVGISGITALNNGNYVVNSWAWDNGAVTDAGAVTWGSGTAGVSGVVSSSNSLVGTTINDMVGNTGITALSNGNYVVNSYYWNNGTAVDAGAVTWGSGMAGVKGAVSSSNSLVGTTTNDAVGNGGITALNNGNYVVNSYYWNNGVVIDAGAVTWGSGTVGVFGAISSSNSLVGTTANNQVGYGGSTALSNGNYVVNSWTWDNGTATDAGAVTWGSGTAGVKGAVSSSNSLVGTTTNDNVGYAGITALNNGNYVVNSSNWNNGTVFNAGAVTWSSGTAGISGVVSSSNSLVGTTEYDYVGTGGITALNNGNYVVLSTAWDNDTAMDAGAVTWGSGTAGISGVVSSSNSLVGTTEYDNVGIGITALSNGNYVVNSYGWDNGTAMDAGAVTWGSGTAGISGVVSSSNSLVGVSVNDNVGNGGSTELSNGNYVVNSYGWDNGTVMDAGAVTWGNGTSGISGVVSSSNSLVGTTANDAVGLGSITALSNGNYVVKSPNWNNGTITSAGAVTWGNGTTGVSGVVSSSNSLVGAGVNDNLGNGGITALSNGNYIVATGTWDNGTLVDAGQVRVATPQNIAFNNGIGQTMSFNPGLISQTLASGTNVTLQASNDITLDTGTNIAVSGTTGGKLTLQAGRNITLNSSISTANGDFLAIAGDPNATATDRDPGTPTLTLGAGATINAGTGKVTLLANGGNFTNNSGSVTPITASQWWVYSTDPAANTANGMNTQVGVNKHYNQTYTGTVPAYATSGNWFLYSVAPVLTVAPNIQTVTYGTAPSFAPVYTGFIDGDTSLTAGISGTPNFTGGITSTSGNYAVGTYNLVYASGLLNSLGYTIVDNATSTNELTVNKLDLAVTGLSANSKVYDGNNTANLTGTAAISQIPNDVVNLNGIAIATFTDKNVATNKTVNVTGYSISGADAGNYNLVQPTLLVADITAKALTVSGITANNKVYDGNTSATLNLAGILYNGLIAGDAFSFNGTGSFIDKNVGTGKTVNLTNSYTGADVTNYSITSQANTTANITPQALIVSGITANNKVYDGNTSATLNLAGILYNGLIAGDEFSFNGIGSFSDKNVGAGKTVNLSNSYIGTDVTNYAITPQANTTADITAKALTVSGITANNKVYDGNTNATLNLAGILYNGLIAGDAFSFNGTGSFTDPNIGTGKTVNLTNSYTGADVTNYSITHQASTIANITAKALIVFGITANNKVYDGTTSAILDLTGINYVGLTPGDTVIFNGTGSFSDKNVGAGKTVNLTNSYIGANVAEYTITSQVSTTADIIAKALTVSGITASNKVYDGTTNATLAGTAAVTPLLGDTVNLGGIGTATFTDKNAGINKTVTVTGYSLNGVDAGNYNLVQPTRLTADITAKALTVSGITANNKVYDGNTSAILNLAGINYAGLITGDAFSFNGGTGRFTDQNIGIGKTVNLINSYTGADVNNYSIIDQSNTIANINQANLTILANNASKTFGQTLNFNGTEFSSTGLVNNETIAKVDLSSSGAAANAAVINSPYDIVVSNATGGTFNLNNYNIIYVNGKLTVNPLSVPVIPVFPVMPVIPNVPIIRPIIPNTPIIIRAPNGNFTVSIMPTTTFALVPVTSMLFNFDDQLVPLQTSITGIKHAEHLRWFYPHWLQDMFVHSRYSWLFNNIKQHAHSLRKDGVVNIVNHGMKLPK